MHARALALLALASISCAALNRHDPASTRLEAQNRPRPGPAAPRLRVATYNVHQESAAHIRRAIEGNPELRRADVIFFEEIESHAGEVSSRAAALAAMLGRSYAYAPGYGLNRGGSHGVAIVSRFPLRDARVIELPRRFVVFNSARRVAIGATIEVAGRPVRLYAVHLDNRINPSDRTEQLAPVLADARRHPGMPAIIGGDMNTSPFCWIGHVVPVPCGLQDSRLERYVRSRGFDTPVTASGATSKWLAMRLDALYTRGLEVTDFGVDDVVRVSDHLPLWADVRLGVAFSHHARSDPPEAR